MPSVAPVVSREQFSGILEDFFKLLSNVASRANSCSSFLTPAHGELSVSVKGIKEFLFFLVLSPLALHALLSVSFRAESHSVNLPMFPWRHDSEQLSTLWTQDRCVLKNVTSPHSFMETCLTVI